MLASLFSKPQPSLSVQAKRLVAMRFLIYTGFQTSYFIGVIGTLTYADGASVVATSLAVLFMNVFVILGSFAGGAALDAWGPRRHFLLSIVGTLATGAAIIAFGSATGIVLLGAVLLGFVMGFAQPIATSYPAYLTDDPAELKDINSAIAMFSNVSIIVGPTLGGFVAAAASSRAVFVLMMLFTALALIAGWGFRPQAGRVAARESTPADSGTTAITASQSSNPSTFARVTFATSIKTVFTNSILALLFCIIFLSNFGYGAFDPLESFFYRDILHVGVEWMGWLSSASGVGAVLGAVVALRLPPHLVNLKTLLVALMSVGLGSLLYVGTPYVGVALVGQIVLGVAWGVVNPLHNTIVQTTAPLEQLGRVNSVMGFGNMFAGVAPLAIAPWLAATFGVQQTLIGAGMVVTAVPAALLLFGRWHFDRAAKQQKPSQHSMKITILPKNVECCDALRLGPGHPSGSATTKGAGTFVVVFALTGRACALVYHVRRSRIHPTPPHNPERLPWTPPSATSKPCSAISTARCSRASTRCPRAPWRRSAPCASAACCLACAPGATPMRPRPCTSSGASKAWWTCSWAAVAPRSSTARMTSTS